jgi:hypothetical protein
MVARAWGPVFMFCATELFFGGAEGVRSCFHVLRFRARFRRYRGLRVPFHVLRFRTHFRQYREHPVPFSCFTLRDSFCSVPMASGPVLKFCAPGLIFGYSEGAGSRFHVFLFRTRFRRYQGRLVPISSFALPDTFRAELRASSPVFMFRAPGLIFDSTEGAVSYFHVLRSRIRFGRYRGCRVQFSSFAHQTRFRRYRGRRVSFSCFALSEPFWADRVRRVPFSCFALPNSFSAMPRLSGVVFIFCVPGFILGGTEGAVSCIHFLRSRTSLGLYRGRRVSFHILRS